MSGNETQATVQGFVADLEARAKTVPSADLAASVATECAPINEVLARVGDKWTVLVVGLLAASPRRFNELRRLIAGISQRMLTLTLRGLERDGIVTRTVTPTVPPRVDYALTELGTTLIPPVLAIAGWARANRLEIDAARRRFDALAGAATRGTDRAPELRRPPDDPRTTAAVSSAS